MNTGFLGPAVATVLTACGIETSNRFKKLAIITLKLQQYLPLAVLKLKSKYYGSFFFLGCCNSTYRLRY